MSQHYYLYYHRWCIAHLGGEKMREKFAAYRGRNIIHTLIQHYHLVAFRYSTAQPSFSTTYKTRT